MIPAIASAPHCDALDLCWSATRSSHGDGRIYNSVFRTHLVGISYTLVAHFKNQCFLVKFGKVISSSLLDTLKQQNIIVIDRSMLLSRSACLRYAFANTSCSHSVLRPSVGEKLSSQIWSFVCFRTENVPIRSRVSTQIYYMLFTISHPESS